MIREEPLGPVIVLSLLTALASPPARFKPARAAPQGIYHFFMLSGFPLFSLDLLLFPCGGPGWAALWVRAQFTVRLRANPP